MELKKVLLIDDVKDVHYKVMKAFEEYGVVVVPIQDISELEQHLGSRDFQMIILDWLLDGESSTLAKVCLHKIRDSYFVPVLVWTEELESFKTEEENVKKSFPEACLKALSKSEVDYKDLLDFLANWYEKTPAKLSNWLRKSIIASVEEALYTLAAHSEDDLARGLKILISLEDTSKVVDMEHVTDVLLRLVGRAIYTNEEFNNQVRQAIEDLKYEPKRREKIVSRIQKLHMYYKPQDNFVRTGDIVKIIFDADVQSEDIKGVVVTPACDLARPKTAFLRLALINERVTQGTPGADKFELRFLTDDEKIFEVCFHEILVVKNQTFDSYNNPKERPVMLYEHEYKTLNGTKVVLERLLRLDEPYRADLLHCFVSHAGRIGIPEFTA